MLSPIAKKGLKTLGKEAVRVGSSVAADALSGANPIESLEERGKQSAVRMLRKINRSAGNKRKGGMKGGRRRRRKRVQRRGAGKKRRVNLGGRKRRRRRKPRKKQDIFDSF